MVNNLFIRLYLLIVFSIVTIGLGTNWLWQNYFESNDIISAEVQSETHHTIIKAIELALSNTPTPDRDVLLQQLATELSLPISLIEANSLPGDLFLSNHQQVQPLLLSTEIESLSDNSKNSNPALFYPLRNSNKVLKLSINNVLENESGNLNQNMFLVAFYLLVAIAIFYWIWPLSKDLNKLQAAVKMFDDAHWDAKVNVPTTSSISHLAEAYNHLLEKIKRMVENEKSMANSISHELRTPLARARFALQMAKEEVDLDKVYCQIESAEEDIQEMNQLISELLSYAAIENIAFEASFSRGNMNELITSIVERLKKNHPQHDILFNMGGKKPTVRCDENLIEKALQNLVTNACKYGNGVVKIVFSSTQISEKRSHSISVSNNGKPIAKEQQENIFESFYQIPSNDKRSGFGIGLALVKRIAELHGGKINVKNSTLGGAKFVLSWDEKV